MSFGTVRWAIEGLDTLFLFRVYIHSSDLAVIDGHRHCLFQWTRLRAIFFPKTIPRHINLQLDGIRTFVDNFESKQPFLLSISHRDPLAFSRNFDLPDGFVASKKIVFRANGYSGKQVWQHNIVCEQLAVLLILAAVAGWKYVRFYWVIIFQHVQFELMQCRYEVLPRNLR